VDKAVRDPILWRCRRGMRELDVLLERFAREHYRSASPAHRRAFERLLELPDPVLVDLLLLAPPGLSAYAASAAGGEAAGAGTRGPHGLEAHGDLAEIAALVAAAAHR
jgi:succinate dehydrogenase flavin-adding protein (antitoxin of CptAB toxin-antitoxin module)